MEFQEGYLPCGTKVEFMVVTNDAAWLGTTLSIIDERIATNVFFRFDYDLNMLKMSESCLASFMTALRQRKCVAYLESHYLYVHSLGYKIPRH